MSTTAERIEVFQDTMDWINSDSDLTTSVTLAKQKTTIFYEDDYPAFDMSSVKDTVVTVTGDRSYQAAMRLRKENPDAKIAVMNFANAFHAGGGVTKGSGAQEECLCRTSTLYPLLYRRTLRDSFYKHHSDLNTPKASDSLIYTEGVVICKTDEDLPQRMPREDWVTVDVITIAAPDLRRKSNMHAPLVNGGAYMNDAELFGYHVKRAIHMLTCAAAKGADVLVLGAFGCGAFQNNPEVVARAYKIALAEFPKVFEKIEFAVYCPPGGSTNYEVFNEILGKGCNKENNLMSLSAKYANLTAFLDEMKEDQFGTWHHEQGHKGTIEDPIPMPYPVYTQVVRKFTKAVYEFAEENPEYDLNNYLEILEKKGIKDIDKINVEELDDKTLMTVLFSIVRQERFCDGLILSCFENGLIQKILHKFESVSEKTKGKAEQSIELIHGSCADQKADVVVNAANKYLAEGAGICGVIFKKAGSMVLAQACSKHKTPLSDGDAVITPAFGLKNAKAIIHAVGPDFRITKNAFDELKKAYYNSMIVMMENGYHSISFPLISAGIFGGDLPDPARESTKQCYEAYKQFCAEYPEYVVNVLLCAYGADEYTSAKDEIVFLEKH